MSWRRAPWGIALGLWWSLIAAVLMTSTTSAPPPMAAAYPRRLATRHLANAIQITDWVISGGVPEDDHAFAELSALGIRSIISVDGARPDLARAARYRLRYVHLPHGYEGLGEERMVQLAQAIQQLPKPIYLHCHHGKHRSPTAAAVACLATGQITTQQARHVLQLAGTNPSYLGLFHAVEQAQVLAPKVLREPQVEFPELVAVPPLAESMVSIDEAHGRLSRLAKNDWTPLTEQPQMTAHHQALLLVEQLTELSRASETQQRPDRFRAILSEQLTTAQQLQELLEPRAPEHDSLKLRRQETFAQLSRLCTDCHRQFRDNVTR
jgi:protein tyrosine phosphatase (PTP) superfamily phosphohydrolase (DUF442 family)